MTIADHPHTDPGDGRTECDVCGKWVFPVTHSCKGVPVTEAAWDRHRARVTGDTVGSLRATLAAGEADGWRGWACHCAEQGYPGPHPRSEGCSAQNDTEVS